MSGKKVCLGRERIWEWSVGCPGSRVRDKTLEWFSEESRYLLFSCHVVNCSWRPSTLTGQGNTIHQSWGRNMSFCWKTTGGTIACHVVNRLHCAMHHLLLTQWKALKPKCRKPHKYTEKNQRINAGLVVLVFEGGHIIHHLGTIMRGMFKLLREHRAYK